MQYAYALGLKGLGELVAYAYDVVVLVLGAVGIRLFVLVVCVRGVGLAAVRVHYKHLRPLGREGYARTLGHHRSYIYIITCRILDCQPAVNGGRDYARAFVCILGCGLRGAVCLRRGFGTWLRAGSGAGALNRVRGEDAGHPGSGGSAVLVPAEFQIQTSRHHPAGGEHLVQPAGYHGPGPAQRCRLDTQHKQPRGRQLLALAQALTSTS